VVISVVKTVWFGAMKKTEVRDAAKKKDLKKSKSLKKGRCCVGTKKGGRGGKSSAKGKKISAEVRLAIKKKKTSRSLRGRIRGPQLGILRKKFPPGFGGGGLGSPKKRMAGYAQYSSNGKEWAFEERTFL